MHKKHANVEVVMTLKKENVIHKVAVFNYKNTVQLCQLGFFFFLDHGQLCLLNNQTLNQLIH